MPSLGNSGWRLLLRRVYNDALKARQVRREQGATMRKA
jgi:hypothetical protein